MGSEKPADGSGNAVADLKAGFGAALSSAAEVGGNFRRVTQPDLDPERVVPVPGNSRWEDEAAYWRNRALRAEGGDLEPVTAEQLEGEPVVEQGDGWYWMNRCRRAEERLRVVSQQAAEARVSVEAVCQALKGGESDG